MLRAVALHLVICLLALLSSVPELLGAEPEHPQLRIRNMGNRTIEDLTVLFPLEHVRFGDVAPGATTEYEDVPAGVYRYAAYQFSIDGKLVSRPVTDFFGERPIEGDRFTYFLRYVDSVRPMVQLEEVARDR